MLEAKDPARRAIDWLRRRAPALIEADAVLAALVLVHCWVVPLPAAASFATLTLALVLPRGGRPLSTTWSDYAHGLPYRFAVMVLTGVLGYFAFGLPLPALAFAPVWLGLGILWVVAHQSPVRTSIRIARIIDEWSRPHLRAGEAAQADLWLADLAIWGTAFYLAAAFMPGFWPHAWMPVAILFGWCGVRGWKRWHRLAPGVGEEVRGVLTGVLALAALTAGLRALAGSWTLHLEFTLFFWGTVAALAVRLAALRRERHQSVRAPELMRWVIVGVIGLWLLRGLARYALHGTDDALWYGTMLADVVTQFRAGIFPFWTGQSIYQFNGAIYPLRVAPGFLYLGALLDTLTFHSLGIFALQNLMLTLLGLGAIFSAYFCLAALIPGRPGIATGMAVLFLACPGVLGLVYSNDLYMSWTTLPWIPVIWYATVRSFWDRGIGGTLVLLGVALGLCWWGHSPIALWSTLLAALAQGARIACQGLHRDEFASWAVAAVLFAAIAAYPIGSVLFYPPQAGIRMDGFQRATAEAVAAFVASAFPGILEPLSHNGRSLSDFQLGYALWCTLIGCTWLLRRARRPEQLVTMAMAWVLLLLLLPIPWLNLQLWTLVPATIRNTTGNWAMNRLYFPLAGAVIFGAGAACAAVHEARAKAARWLGPWLGAGCAWSILQAGAFAQGSIEGAHTPASASNQLRPENVVISRFAYLIFPSWPAWFNHGVVDPAMENRLRDARSLAVIASDTGAAEAASREIAAGQFRRLNEPAVYSELDRTFLLEPGRRYLLEFEFMKPETSGVLQIEGAHLFREYGLPDYGGASSFGAGGTHSRVIPVWTSGPEREKIRLRFVSEAAPADPRRTPTFARVRQLLFDPAAVPVRVTSWLPYSAEVTSPAKALVETPRMYLDGYIATVDAKPVQVVRSPEGLVCVPVPAGFSRITLAYHPPVGLAALLWTSLLGMAAAAVLGCGSLLPSSRPLRA